MIHVGVVSDPGRVRTQNQDHYGVERLGRLLLAAVADGMGGHQGGEVASHLAVSTLFAHVARARAQLEQAPRSEFATMCRVLLRQGFQAANEAVYEQARTTDGLAGMGTTLTALLTDAHHAVFAHVGDTRAYHFRQGRLSSVTEDHSLVAELIRQGDLAATEADSHPQRHIITRAVGTECELQVDTTELVLNIGDHLVLASDGLTTLVETDEIASLVAEALDPEAIAHQAVALANERGGHDNITVLVIRFGEGAGT